MNSNPNATTHFGRSSFFVLVVFTTLGSFVQGDDSLPTWTNTDGRTVQAEFAGLEAEILEVRKDGKLFKVPFSSLTPQSRIQAKELAMRQELEQRNAEALNGDETLSDLWDRIQGPRQQDLAVLDLAKHSAQVTQFLSDKLQPVRLSREELMKLLNDLCSDNVDTWRGAYKSLSVLDPRLAMDVEALFALESFQEFPYRNRLVDVLTGASLDSPYSASGLEFKKIELRTSSNGAISFSASEPADPKYGNHGYSANKLGDEFKGGYTAITHALAMLEYLDTTEAKGLIERMASGDPRVSVTRIAKKILDQQAGTTPPQSIEDHWNNLDSGEVQFTSGHDVNEFVLAQDRSILALARDPAATTSFLATKLKSEDISRDEMQKLLTDFSSDEESRWKHAYERLQIFSPLLEFTVADLLQLETYQEYPARHRLVDLLTGTPIDSPRSATNAKFEFVTLKEQPVFGEPGICMDYRNPDPASKAGFGSSGGQCFPLLLGGGDMRLGLGLTLLEVFNTREADELLKSIATGHPKMESTVMAKAILKERSRQ